MSVPQGRKVREQLSWSHPGEITFHSLHAIDLTIPPNLYAYKFYISTAPLISLFHSPLKHLTGPRPRSNTITWLRKKIKNRSEESLVMERPQPASFTIEQIFQSFAHLSTTNQRDPLVKYIVSVNIVGYVQWCHRRFLSTILMKRSWELNLELIEPFGRSAAELFYVLW